MPLSWNEIKSRALAFSKEWQQASSEDAEAKSFWDGFFNVFGITRKRVASFEEPVRKLGKNRFIAPCSLFDTRDCSLYCPHKILESTLSA